MNADRSFFPALGTAPDRQRDDDLRACRALLRGGSKTFLAASRLLPPRVRAPACALYAWCREADDGIDGAPGPAAAAEALAGLRAQLQRLAAGDAGAAPAERAMAVLLRRYRLPVALPAALLEGFAWDVEGRRYDTLAELEAYAARVAGAVGAMMAVLMGVRDPAALARACDLGVAMQLSNIARDVGEDARLGRLYLPQDWMREVGLDPQAWLADPRHSTALARVVARLLAEAERLYRQAETGIARLPADCRPGIRVATRLYAEIGHEVARRDHDAVQARAVVSGRRKLQRALGALRVPAAADAALATAPPLAATRFLVEAASEPAPAAVRPPQWWAFGARWGRVLATFERLALDDR